MGGTCVAEDDPEAGMVSVVVAGANGAGELGDFEAGAADQIAEDAASVVDKVAKTLGDENGVYIAGGGLFELVEIVIGQRLFERDFDGGGGLILVRGDSNGHGGYVFTPRGLFRIGAAGQNGEGAVELLGEHDAGEFVREGHGAERKFLVSALTECVREAVSVAAEEDEVAGAAVAKFTEPFGKGARIETLPGSVEKHDSGGAARV